MTNFSEKIFNQILHFNKKTAWIDLDMISQALAEDEGDLRLASMHLLDHILDADNISVEFKESYLREIGERIENRIAIENVSEVISGFDNKNKHNFSSILGAVGIDDIHHTVKSISSRKNLSPVSIQTQPKSLTIIVHGTWASSKTWWQKGGTFWNYVNTLVPDLYQGQTPFKWSGDNRHTKRKAAANDLVNWLSGIQDVDIIAHSHGGNVAIEATRIGLKIRKLILLGTPVRYEYVPLMKNIQQLYCVFSKGDFVQKIGAQLSPRGDGRTMADSNKLVNCYADNNGNKKKPSHSELHEPQTWQHSEHMAGIL
ncbi:alpha/beta hydrolase [Microbulbifer bruguierae]|uniref:Alpha/beta hydrolase n=1 Tax=Microbulbifer bruguierae TaxID=3029061 RepID=A0ABY8NDS1_9GAMM|nr:alpha/beta hydrolase [Microbulbifer bruguierae]WGL15902.1 alpha/beta hydrolase [Microbulbifer bruguierae]